MKNEIMYFVDVCEDWEYDICNIDVEYVFMYQVIVIFVDKDKVVNYVIICKLGNCVQVVVNLLEIEGGFENIYVLEGGIIVWLIFIDFLFEIY